MLERRKSPRIKCQIFTELCEGESTLLGIGEIFDISAGGAGLESHTPFVVGQRAILRFMLDEELIISPIEIVRVQERPRRKKFYGIKFISTDSQILEKIEKFVSKKIQ